MRTDVELLREYARTNDAAAFEQLSRRYRDMVFAVARRITRDHHDAEDVAQACFLELAKRAASVKTSLPAYLHTAATRRAINCIRDDSRRRHHEQEAATKRPKEAPDTDPAERSWDEIAVEIDEAIEELPETLRVPVVLYYLRGLSEPEIARELEMAEATVGRRLRVGVRQLRATLAKGSFAVSAGIITVGLKTTRFPAPPSLRSSIGRMALAGLGRQLVVKPARRFHWAALFPFGISFSVWTWFLLASVVGGGLFLYHNRSARNPYDRIAVAYAPYLASDAIPGISWRSSVIRRDVGTFWRGEQILFYDWAKQNTQDWLKDSDAYLLCQATPQLSDIYRMPADIDADNSARLPLQLELLQGLLTVKFASDAAEGGVSCPMQQLAKELCETYRSSLLDPSASNNHVVNTEDADELNRYIDSSGQFRQLVHGERGKVVEFLRPAEFSPQQVAIPVQSAISRNAKLAAYFGLNGKIIEVEVKALCRRIRMNSIDAQGQASFLAWVELSSASSKKCVLLEIKQRAPSPAELSGIIQPDSRSPGQRVAKDSEAVSNQCAFPMGWCEIGAESFTVRPHIALTGLPSLEDEHSEDALTAAREWAMAVAATHRNDPHRTQLAGLITPALESQLATRADAYASMLNDDLDAFRADPRVARDESIQDKQMAMWVGEANRSARKEHQ
jgi:RNA polymerase sigma factor (sigma-70 family)